MREQERLIVFVKAPRVGEVKTRLAAAIGPAAAREAYLCLVKATLQAVGNLKNVELRYSPDDGLTEISPWLRPGWGARAQGQGDLGDRLHRAFAESLKEVERVVVIGSDCPEIAAADVQMAWRALEADDVVLGPALDGGYWLVALKQTAPELFEGIAWSSDRVLAQTVQKTRDLGLRVRRLRQLADVDTAEDWEEFLRRGK